MNEPALLLGSEDLFDLAARLRAADISAAPDQLAAAIDLVYRLQLSERDDARRQLGDYRALLAPIFCRSAEEQELFHDLYTTWAKEKEATQEVPDTPAASEPQPPPKPPPKNQTWVGFLIFAIIAGFFIFRLLNPATSPEAEQEESLPTPTRTPAGETPPTQQSPIPVREDMYAAAVPRPPERIPARILLPGGIELTSEEFRLAPVGLATMAFIGWLIWRIGRRRILLERHPVDGSETPKLHVVRVKGSDAQLFTRQHLRPTIDRLRNPVRTTTPNIDMPRTIEATLRANGLFTPVYRRRRRLPEYVVLIDRAHPRDHLGAFAFEMIDRLRRENLSVYAYYFYGDPRRCQLYDATYATVHLDEIEAQHGGARLLLLSDCAGLFSPLSGRLERWVIQLERWPERVVMTPQPSQRWGYTELSLCLGGFIVTPLTSEGLRLVADHFADRALEGENAAGSGVLIASAHGESILPRIIELYFDAWIEREPPPGADLDVLFPALRRYLGADGMRVLAAAAVYPEITWPLLMFLDWRLAPANDTDAAREDRLFNLARLPWCRHAHIPDYLRFQLIRTLTESETQEVRNLFRSLFDSALVEGAKSLEFTIAEPPSEKRWDEIVRQWFTSRRDDTREADYIYPKVLLSGQPGLLDFELPRQLMRLLPGARWHRVTAASVAALAIAALLGSAAWFGYGLIHSSVEKQFASIERSRNADYPVQIWHPAEQQETARALALTLRQWGFPVALRSVRNMEGGEFSKPVIVYGRDDGKRTADWLAERVSFATYIPQPTVFTWIEGAQMSQVLLGLANSQDHIDVSGPESGARILLMRRLNILIDSAGQRSVGTPVSFQDRLAKGSLGPVVTIIPGGTFRLGASEDSVGYEGPTPTIDIRQQFGISQREVTVDEFARFVDETGHRTEAERDGVGCSLAGRTDLAAAMRTSWRSPGFEQTGSHPVVCVSWNDAQAYISWLAQRTGETYRLPTETEWEYAARDGEATRRHPWQRTSEACSFANVSDSGSATTRVGGRYPCDDGARNTAPVASYPASRFALHDMLGNVSEWVQDCWESAHEKVPTDGTAFQTPRCSSRVIRGMDWQTDADNVDVVNRGSLAPASRSNVVGFRVVRLVTQPARQAAAK